MARVRKQPGTREALMQYAPIVVLEPEQHKGKWQDVFGNANPIQMEVGMGKGKFISTMARQHPEINFIGVEVIEEVLLDAVKRMNRAEGIPENLRLVWINASLLEDLFLPGEVDRIFLNFSDPWPKTRHAKRRLTHKGFLDQYAAILKAEGQVHFKTDNQGLFEFSLNEFSACGWRLQNIQLDMYQKLPEGNVATEYETKFHNPGMPIYRLEAVKPKSC
ncbi:MAG: tRNA (guanosine(46)-N7)-methyltransferase TrmB [Peptococcaceae bacterium]|nr:tRNA (guanosine(46)-N7)-methyltransferase TrmB [Peptococcaceae bacterium]